MAISQYSVILKWLKAADLISHSGLVVDHFLVLGVILKVFFLHKILDLLFDGFNFSFKHLDVFYDLFY